MADEATTTEATQDDAATTTPEQDTATEQAEVFDADYVAKLRREAADYRTKAKVNADAAKRLAQLEDANKSETEKLTDRAAAAEADRDGWRGRYMDLAKRQAITEAAVAARTTDAETVYLYLRDEVEIDDDGNPAGVAKALKQLQQRKPHLFRATADGQLDAAAKGTPPALNSDALTDALSRAVGV